MSHENQPLWSLYFGLEINSFAQLSTSSRGANSEVMTNSFPQFLSSNSKAAFSRETIPLRLGKYSHRYCARWYCVRMESIQENASFHSLHVDSHNHDYQQK